MKKVTIFIVLITIIVSTPVFGGNAGQDSLRTLSLKALEKLKTVKAVPFKRTTHPGAQWFPDASFGLFMHWGIHSVAGIQPSWAMMKDMNGAPIFQSTRGRVITPS